MQADVKRQDAEIWIGGVNTWECDEMGHLNVRFWAAKAVEALAALAARVGMPRAFAPDAGATLLIREQYIRFLREAHPGACLTATGGVVSMGEADARVLIVLRHPSGDPAATFQFVVEHATSGDLRPFAWPERVRRAAENWTVEVPTYAAARTMDLSPVDRTMASLAQAESFGMTCIGRGVVQPAEVDVFGRMRPEMFIGRVSDGVGRLFEGPGLEPDGDRRIGRAVVEYRILHHDWPGPGGHVEVRSGFGEGTSRIRRIFHWLVDPVSGRPWCSSEVVALSFDLDTRKMVELPPEALAELAARSIPGIGL